MGSRTITGAVVVAAVAGAIGYGAGQVDSPSPAEAQSRSELRTPRSIERRLRGVDRRVRSIECRLAANASRDCNFVPSDTIIGLLRDIEDYARDACTGANGPGAACIPRSQR